MNVSASRLANSFDPASDDVIESLTFRPFIDTSDEKLQRSVVVFVTSKGDCLVFADEDGKNEMSVCVMTIAELMPMLNAAVDHQWMQ